MSTGRFLRSRYGAGNLVDIYAIRVQPETLLLQIGTNTNAPPAGTITQRTSALATGGRRNKGMNARKVRFTFPDGGAPEGYKEGSVLTLPILTQSMYNDIAPNQVGQYLGVPIIVVGKTPEYEN